MQGFKAILSFISKVLGSLGYMRPNLNKIVTVSERALVHLRGGVSYTILIGNPGHKAEGMEDGR